MQCLLCRQTGVVVAFDSVVVAMAVVIGVGGGRWVTHPGRETGVGVDARPVVAAVVSGGRWVTGSGGENTLRRSFLV